MESIGKVLNVAWSIGVDTNIFTTINGRELDIECKALVEYDGEYKLVTINRLHVYTNKVKTTNKHLKDVIDDILTEALESNIDLNDPSLPDLDFMEYADEARLSEDLVKEIEKLPIRSLTFA